MANMSYVRFENTLEDLEDCASNLYDDVSKTEHNYRRALIQTCRRIAASVPEGEEDLLPSEYDYDHEEEDNDV